MAVTATDASLQYATTELILPKPLKFYCAPMRSGRLELCSLISSPRPNILFYPNGKDVIVLNTKTRESYLFTTLKFEPRCLTASNEWLCCGGDKGDYSAIYFGDGRQTEPYLGQDSEPDARLPLDLDPFWRSIPAERQCRDIRPLGEVSKIVGLDVVNCISIWSPSEISSECTYQESVALVSNNDRSISILRLSDCEVLEKLTLPDRVTRSLMSPDGDMLISVCDNPFLYIHRRKVRWKNKKEKLHSSKGGYYWSLEGRIQLEGQIHNSDIPRSHGSFAATFSPSGKYLAVAAQHGSIFIFEKEEIFAPPVSIFTASRMNSLGDGFVGAMEFCTGPFDLLAWTEHRGRVGIADVRNLFLSRQILILDPNHLEDIEKIPILDRLVDPSVGSRRLRSDSLYRVISDHPGLDLETGNRRQSRNLTHDDLNSLSHRRTQLRILEPHFSRQQREGNSVRESSTPTGWRRSIEVRRPISISYITNNFRSGRTSTAGLPATLREFLNQDRAQSFRSYLHDRNRENDRRNQHEPIQDSGQRRRLSMQNTASILAGADSVTERESRRNENDPASTLERLSLSSSQGRNVDSETPWSLRQRITEHPPPPTDQSSSRLHIRLEEDDRGDLESRMDELIDFALDAQRVFSAQRSRSQDEEYISTMGCCWSQDGKILYAATEDGIHEFHVNVLSRKLFPRLAFC